MLNHAEVRRMLCYPMCWVRAAIVQAATKSCEECPWNPSAFSKERGRGSSRGRHEAASRSTPPGELPGRVTPALEKCDLRRVRRLVFRDAGSAIAIGLRKKVK